MKGLRKQYLVRTMPEGAIYPCSSKASRGAENDVMPHYLPIDMFTRMY